MAVVNVEKVIEKYGRGVLTLHEVLAILALAASEQPPEELVPLIPEEVLAELREWSATPPKSPNKRIYDTTVVFRYTATDAERHFHQKLLSQQLHDGLWRWHRYFASKASFE